MITYYLKLFIIFSVIGWVVDTIDRSLLEKKIVSGTYIPLFSPLYGLGGVLLTVIIFHFNWPAYLEILLGALSLTLLELLAGLWCTNIIKRRLWDYSQNRFNLWGHTDLEHAFYWLMISIIFYLLQGYFKP